MISSISSQLLYCKICGNELLGRKDKLFCNINCKNYYHLTLRRLTKDQALSLDTILKRNRSILLELLGKNKFQIKLNRIVLEQKNFRFNYHTHVYTNSKGKAMHYIYDIGWMDFSSDEVFILKNRKNLKKLIVNEAMPF